MPFVLTRKKLVANELPLKAFLTCQFGQFAPASHRDALTACKGLGSVSVVYALLRSVLNVPHWGTAPFFGKEPQRVR